jgi:hypothetical protein
MQGIDEHFGTDHFGASFLRNGGGIGLWGQEFCATGIHFISFAIFGKKLFSQPFPRLLDLVWAALLLKIKAKIKATS